MFFNAQKPQSNGLKSQGEILLNARLFRLKKTDRATDPDGYNKALQELTGFLNHDERAPGPQKPFLNDQTLRLFSELSAENKLPGLNSGLPADDVPWHWGGGVESIAIAAKLTQTKKDVVTQLRKAGEELARDPNPDPTKFQQQYQTTVAPFYEFLEKFLPPAERQKHKHILEQEGSEILTEKVQQVTQLGKQIGASAAQQQQVQKDISAKVNAMRRFTNSEEYIQHVLGRYEDRLLTTKTIGKALGDITIGSGVLFFAPSTVVPFIVAGYIGHRLSTMNVTARKDRKEQRLRDQSAQFEQDLDTLSVQQFGTFGQRLGAYLSKIKLLPALGARNTPVEKTKAAPAMT